MNYTSVLINGFIVIGGFDYDYSPGEYKLNVLV